MFDKIRLGSSLAALVLFAFPWISFKCADKSIVTQSGLQVAYGSGSASPEIEALSKELKSVGMSTNSVRSTDDSVDSAPLVGLALLAVIGAAVFAVIATFRGGEHAVRMSAILPTIALTLLLIQLMIGFPFKKKFDEAVSEEASKSQPEGARLGASMAMTTLQVKITPFLYFELLVLAIPTLLLANTFIDKHRNGEQTDAVDHSHGRS